jgi:hypothetical protein
MLRLEPGVLKVLAGEFEVLRGLDAEYYTDGGEPKFEK